MHAGHMQIGQVAQRTALSVRTIRFYEESGLVVPSARSRGGFRLYTEDDVQRLQTIRQLKPLKLTIEEIRELMSLLDQVRVAATPGARCTAPLIQRLTSYLEQAEHAVAELHAQWSAAATFAAGLRGEIDTLVTLGDGQR